MDHCHHYISNNIYPLIILNPNEKLDSIRVEINFKIGERDRNTLYIYVPIFKTGLVNALIKFLVLLKKIRKFQNLTTGTHRYVITKNLLEGKSLQVFEQKTRAESTNMTEKYKLLIEILTTHFFPKK